MALSRKSSGYEQCLQHVIASIIIPIGGYIPAFLQQHIISLLKHPKRFFLLQFYQQFFIHGLVR